MERKDGRQWLRLVISVGLAVTSVIVISWLLESRELSLAMRLTLAAIPVLAFGVCVMVFVSLIRTIDEMQRQVHLEALGFAFPATAVVLLAFEYLRKAGVLSQLKPDYILAAMALLWMIGFVVARRRYE